MSTPIQTTTWMDAGAGASAPWTGGDHASSDTLPAVTKGVYNRALLKRAYPYLMHQQFGEQYPLGLRKGQSMVFRRYEKLPQKTVPLSEGVTPDGTSMVKRDYVATIKQYGDFMIISDYVDMTHVDPVIQRGVELMGEAMGESMDSVYREYLVIGTSVLYVQHTVTLSGAARVNVESSIHPAACDVAIKALKNQEAKMFKPLIPGSTGVNTWPVAASYWCLIHTDMEQDLWDNFTIGSEFTPVERYASVGGIMENEVGKYRNLRFVTSSNTKIFTGEGEGGDDVYVALIFGRDAYGVVPLQRGSGRTIIQPAGGNTDPLEQRNTVGWKSAGCAIILNDAWMYRLEVKHGAGIIAS